MTITQRSALSLYPPPGGSNAHHCSNFVLSRIDITTGPNSPGSWKFHPDANAPLIYAAISAKCYDDGHSCCRKRVLPELFRSRVITTPMFPQSH